MVAGEMEKKKHSTKEAKRMATRKGKKNLQVQTNHLSSSKCICESESVCLCVCQAQLHDQTQTNAEQFNTKNK